MKGLLAGTSAITSTIILESCKTSKDCAHKEDQRNNQPDETPPLSWEDAVLFSKLFCVRTVRLAKHQHIQNLQNTVNAAHHTNDRYDIGEGNKPLLVRYNVTIFHCSVKLA